MSEPETPAAPAEATAAPAAATAAAEKAEKKPKEKKAKAPKSAKAAPPAPVLIGIIAGALLVGGGLGFALVGPRVVAARTPAAAHGEDGAKKKEKKKKAGHEGEKGAGFRIDNLIVNPAGSQGTRFLMTTITVQSENEELVKSLNEHQDEARDIVITTLEAHTMEMLTQRGARDSIKVHLTRALTPLAMADYEPSPKKKGHDDEEPPTISVYLPQFVIQ